MVNVNFNDSQVHVYTLFADEPTSQSIPVLPPATPTTPIVSPTSDISAANVPRSASNFVPTLQGPGDGQQVISWK